MALNEFGMEEDKWRAWITAKLSGSPGGSNTQVQFNDSGAFGGDVDLTWNKTTNTLTVGGSTGASITQLDAAGHTTLQFASGIAVFGAPNGEARVGDCNGDVNGTLSPLTTGTSALCWMRRSRC